MLLTSCGSSTTSNLLGNILTSAIGTGGGTSGVASAATSAIGSAGTGLIGSLISGLFNNISTVSTESIQGTWTYTAPECRFESENLLTQAGGAVVANKVETELDKYLSNIGFTAGTTTFTFDGVSQCVIASGGKTILSGTYSVDSSTRAINIKGTIGLISLNGTAYQSGNTLTLLFDSTKLLGFIKGASTLLGSSSNILSSVFNYDGMKIGMQLTK